MFPFASTFLEADGHPGGWVSDVSIRAYVEAGFPIPDSGESGDHMGVQLLFLSFLCNQEKLGSKLSRMQQRQFLDTSVLTWLPAFLAAVQAERHPFFNTLAQMALEVVVDHRDALSNGLAGKPPFELPQPELDLEDPKTSLRDIAKHLLNAGHSGVFISRDVLRGWSRSGQLPAGFGARQTMLNNLLRSSVDYDGLIQVLDFALEHLAAAREIHTQYLTGGEPYATFAAQWLQRIDATSATLVSIKHRYQTCWLPDTPERLCHSEDSRHSLT